MDVNRVRARIGELRGEFEDRLAALVEVPTVSMDPERRGEMDRCAFLASDYLRAIGARVDVLETGGFPMVVGRVERDPSFPTVTIYNHLDVQPAETADGWRTPPFRFSREESVVRSLCLRPYYRGRIRFSGLAALSASPHSEIRNSGSRGGNVGRMEIPCNAHAKGPNAALLRRQDAARP